MWFQWICAFVRTVEFPTRLSLTMSSQKYFERWKPSNFEEASKKVSRPPTLDTLHGNPTTYHGIISYSELILLWSVTASIMTLPPLVFCIPVERVSWNLFFFLYSLSSSSSSRHNYFFILFQIGTWIPFISTCKKRWKFPLNAWTF